jgi:hypothetical protein
MTMASIRIFPHYKLLLVYDVKPEAYSVYQTYILNEFIPGMQDLKMYMLGAWHTAYGSYPSRQLEFVMEDLDTMRSALVDTRWQELEAGLVAFTLRYERKLLRFRDGFQFIV